MELNVTITRINEDYLKRMGYNRPSEETTEDGAYITRDLDNDGFITIHNAKTLDIYEKLTYHTEPDIKEMGVFFAFDINQFREGYKRLVTDGHIQQGEKIVQTDMGLFGTSEGIKRLTDFYKSKDKAVAEQCDPQEVYWFEWRNHECNIDWDGDRRAMEHVIRIFGAERARKITRLRGMYEIDEIISAER